MAVTHHGMVFPAGVEAAVPARAEAPTWTQLQKTDATPQASEVIKEPTRSNALLDLILSSNERLTGAVKVKGSLGCCDHEMEEFRIPTQNWEELHISISLSG